MEDPMNKKLVLWLAVAAVAAVAALVLVPLATPSQAVRKDIGSAELLQLQGSGASIVDVRTQGEFEAGHIASAINVPVDQIQQASAGWDKNRPVVVYCASGARSADAVAYLASAGFRKVYDLTGGVAVWTGELVGGPAAADAPSGAAVIETAGKPLFIEFSTST
jgi:rhodanese-related sulfurtransferase